MRFVNPVTVTLPLTGEDWIQVKDALSVGDQKQVEASGLTRLRPGTKDTDEGNAFDLDLAAFSFARTLAYLTDWSFKGADGKDVKVTKASVAALTVEAYQEIEDAITAHVEARDAAKKSQAGG